MEKGQLTERLNRVHLPEKVKSVQGKIKELSTKLQLEDRLKRAKAYLQSIRQK